VYLGLTVAVTCLLYFIMCMYFCLIMNIYRYMKLFVFIVINVIKLKFHWDQFPHGLVVDVANFLVTS